MLYVLLTYYFKFLIKFLFIASEIIFNEMLLSSHILKIITCSFSDSQSPHKVEGLKGKRLISEPQEMLKRPPQSISNERFSSPNILEGLGSKRQISNFSGRGSSATPVSRWKSPENKSKDTSDFVELNIQLNTRVFIKKVCHQANKRLYFNESSRLHYILILGTSNREPCHRANNNGRFQTKNFD